MANPKYSKYGKKYTRKELEAITGGKIFGFVWRDYKRGEIGGCLLYTSPSPRD